MYKLIVAKRNQICRRRCIAYFFYYTLLVMSLFLSLINDIADNTPTTIALFYIFSVATTGVDSLIKYYNFGRQDMIYRQIIIRLEDAGYNFIYLTGDRYGGITSHRDAIAIFIGKSQRIVQYSVLEIRRVQEKKITPIMTNRMVKISTANKFFPANIVAKLI